MRMEIIDYWTKKARDKAEYIRLNKKNRRKLTLEEHKAQRTINDLIDLRSRQETESTDAEERRIKVRFTRANIKTAYEMAKLIRERIEKRKKFLALKKVI